MCPYPRYARQQDQGDMDWVLYRDIIAELGDIGKDNGFRPLLTYCYMGEPFLADNLDKYVAEAIGRGIEVYINTNASVMTPAKIDALLDCGFCGKIHVSFHGITREVYERITGLDYQVTLDNTLYLLDRYDPKRVCVRGVDDNWPEGEKKRWFDYWGPRGVELEYLPPISRCGGVSRLVRHCAGQKDSVRLYGCRGHHPLTEMVILYDGRVVMCCQDMGREVIWGDVAKDGLLGVWNGPIRKKHVERLYSGSACSKQYLCGRCEQALGMWALVAELATAGWRKIIR